jgi:hypothetical protein
LNEFPHVLEEHLCCHTTFLNKAKNIIYYENNYQSLDDMDILVLTMVKHGIKPRAGKSKDYKICIFCFSTKCVALRRKSKDYLVWNQDNMSELVDYKVDIIIIS